MECAGNLARQQRSIAIGTEIDGAQIRRTLSRVTDVTYHAIYLPLHEVTTLCN